MTQAIWNSTGKIIQATEYFGAPLSCYDPTILQEIPKPLFKFKLISEIAGDQNSIARVAQRINSLVYKKRPYLRRVETLFSSA